MNNVVCVRFIEKNEETESKETAGDKRTLTLSDKKPIVEKKQIIAKKASDGAESDIKVLKTSDASANASPTAIMEKKKIGKNSSPKSSQVEKVDVARTPSRGRPTRSKK
jgi:hypothetical protein